MLSTASKKKRMAQRPTTTLRLVRKSEKTGYSDTHTHIFSWDTHTHIEGHISNLRVFYRCYSIKAQLTTESEIHMGNILYLFTSFIIVILFNFIFDLCEMSGQDDRVGFAFREPKKVMLLFVLFFFFDKDLTISRLFSQLSLYSYKRNN